jgi:hypothetical protein
MKDPRDYCSRCNRELSHGSWEDRCYNGSVEFCVDSGSADHLCAEESVDYDRTSMLQHDGHPAAVAWGYQGVKLAWGGCNLRYSLCRACHLKLIGIIGAFFKFPEAALAIERADFERRRHAVEEQQLGTR